MELPQLDFGSYGKSPLNDALAVWLAGLAQGGAQGQGWGQAGLSAPSVPPLPRAQPCCRAWHLPEKVTNSSACQAGHETMGCSLVEKDKLQISHHLTDKTQTASKITHSKLITLPVPESTLPLDPLQTVQIYILYKFLSPIFVHRPCSH